MQLGSGEEAGAYGRLRGLFSQRAAQGPGEGAVIKPGRVRVRAEFRILASSFLRMSPPMSVQEDFKSVCKEKS